MPRVQANNCWRTGAPPLPPSRARWGAAWFGGMRPNHVNGCSLSSVTQGVEKVLCLALSVIPMFAFGKRGECHARFVRSAQTRQTDS